MGPQGKPSSKPEGDDMTAAAVSNTTKTRQGGGAKWALKEIAAE